MLSGLRHMLYPPHCLYGSQKRYVKLFKRGGEGSVIKNSKKDLENIGLCWRIPGLLLQYNIPAPLLQYNEIFNCFLILTQRTPHHCLVILQHYAFLQSAFKAIAFLVITVACRINSCQLIQDELFSFPGFYILNCHSQPLLFSLCIFLHVSISTTSDSPTSIS